MACFTPEERQSFQNFCGMGFCDTFRELYPGKIKYSFWDIRDKSRKENKGWRLDYCICSKAIMPQVTESEIHNDYWGSDHCPISCSVDINGIDLDEFREYMAIEKKDTAALNEIGNVDGIKDDEEVKSDLEDFEEQDMNMMNMIDE